MSSEDVEGHGVNPATVAIFFSSYVLIVGVVLMNIVVAVLLDGGHFLCMRWCVCVCVCVRACVCVCVCTASCFNSSTCLALVVIL